MWKESVRLQFCVINVGVLVISSMSWYEQYSALSGVLADGSCHQRALSVLVCSYSAGSLRRVILMMT